MPSTSDAVRASPLITGRTRLLGLIADPVVQARSPALANASLAARGRLGEYVLVPIQVPEGCLAEAVAALRTWPNFAGAVVSMPHKTAMFGLVDVRTEQAARIGAVNVVRREPDARLVGTALDGEGFVAGLAAAGQDVAGEDVMMAGIGGAGAAVAFALADHGVRSLTILNRTRAKAEAFAGRLRAAHPRLPVMLADAPERRYGLLVNATSLGMREGDPRPFTDDQIDRAQLVAECVLAPEMTPLLLAARARGRAVHTGVPMLTGQLELMLGFMGVEGFPAPA